MSGRRIEGPSCSASIGRINPECSPALEPTIVCPQMTVNRIPRDTPSMSEHQCRLRLQIKGSCAQTCKAILHLKGKTHGR